MADNLFQGSLREHVEALPPAWRTVFDEPAVHDAVHKLDLFLQGRLDAGIQIFPAKPFRALHEVLPEEVKVVIVGQDPYHGPGQAQGLAFSVPDDCRTPPSLRNMFAELAREYPDEYTPQRNSLVRWATQGVLLLNTALTVEAHQAASHAKCGWTTVTDALLTRVLEESMPKVFLLWGSHAQAREALLDTHVPKGTVHVLKANHPSPLSALRPPRPFMGCGHFRQANQWLKAQGETGIDWLHDNDSMHEDGQAPPSSQPAGKPGRGQGTLW